MRKILATFGCLISVAFLLTSCLDDEEEVAVTANASITSFAIGDIASERVTTNSEGEETTVTVTVTGSYYAFAIDHVAGLIYNPDSLPKGTDVSKVTVTLGYEGGYVFYGSEGRVFSTSDSIDFTSPVPFKVYATDGVSCRTYHVSLNVHQTDADSLMWNKVEGNNFSGEALTTQKALLANGRICVFGDTPAGPVLTSALSSDGVEWTMPATLEGFGTAVPDISSATLLGNTFYMLADSLLYSSADGLQWTSVADGYKFGRMVTAVEDKLWLAVGDTLLSGTPDAGWDTVQVVNGCFPVAPSLAVDSLSTNSSIHRATLVGVSDENAAYASVWTKLSTESGWTHYNDTTYGCPALEGLVVITYDGELYAFGGHSLPHAESVEAFEAVYVSADGGITWERKTESLGLPEELLGFEGAHSCVVDGEQNIWLMCSRDGLVYKGRVVGI